MTPITGRGITVDDLVRVRWPMEPALTPDGRHLAFVVSGLDDEQDRLLYQLHRRDLRSGATSAIGGRVDARRPRWSPRGGLLAYISGDPGSAQVSVLDEHGDLAWVASFPGAVTGFGWAPDGRQLVCAVSAATESESRQLPYRVRPGAGLDEARRSLWVASRDAEPRCLLPEDLGSAWLPVWSPDGTAIAFLGHGKQRVAGPGGTRIWRIDVEGGERQLLVRVGGTVTALAWSPDASDIAYLVQGSTPGANQELWIADAWGESTRSISSSVDRSIGQAVRGDDERALGPPDLAWTPDGQRVLAVLAEGGRSGIGWFGRDGRNGTLIGGDRAVLDFDVARDDGTVAFCWSDPWNPGELSLGHLDGRTDHPCTAVNEEWRTTVALAPTRELSHTAEDGVSVQGWLTEPVDVDDAPVPLVVEVHGGPHYPVGWRFSMNAQRLASQGYAVLRLNPRGSQGYGADFATAIHGDWGGQDFRDLMGFVDTTLGTAAVDPARLAIIGESYGGFMVDWALTQTDRFCAAVSENGICDLFVAAAHRSMMSFWHAQMAGPPWDRSDLYVERSPIMHVRSIRTPLLLLESELDPNPQSGVLFAALTELGRDVQLVRTPEEGHWVNLFGRPSRRMTKTRIVDEWLSRHLAGTAATPVLDRPPATTPQEETTHVR